MGQEFPLQPQTPERCSSLASLSPAELQMMVEHHLCKQQGEEEDASVESQEPHSPGCCHHGNTAPSHSPGGTCPLAQAKARLESQEGNCAGPDRSEYNMDTWEGY